MEERFACERDAKMSRVLERRRENWRGVRRGVAGLEAWELRVMGGKMVMWRGFDCWERVS